MTTDREEIARRYGFNSYAELLDMSHRLPATGEDTAPTYVARHPRGHWFIWEDVSRAEREDASNGSRTGSGQG